MAVAPPSKRLKFSLLKDSDHQDLISVLGDPQVMRFSLNGAMNELQIATYIEKTQARYKKDGSVGHPCSNLQQQSRGPLTCSI